MLVVSVTDVGGGSGNRKSTRIGVEVSMMALRRVRLGLLMAVAAAVLALAVAHLTATASGLQPPTRLRVGGGWPVIAAAGDIACDPSYSGFNGGNGSRSRDLCQAKSVADLITAQHVVAVLPLGD